MLPHEYMSLLNSDMMGCACVGFYVCGATVYIQFPRSLTYSGSVTVRNGVNHPHHLLVNSLRQALIVFHNVFQSQYNQKSLLRLPKVVLFGKKIGFQWELFE